jgi:hypothetical protein
MAKPSVWRWANMNDSLAYISYYFGAYGDTIRIATHCKDWVMLFRKNIRDIFDENIQYFDICQMPYIKCFDSIDSLELIKVKIGSTPCVVLKRVDEKNTFKWVQDIEEIETLLGLIDGLIADESPGHQYLACEDDGCIIEFSYNEE